MWLWANWQSELGLGFTDTVMPHQSKTHCLWAEPVWVCGREKFMNINEMIEKIKTSVVISNKRKSVETIPLKPLLNLKMGNLFKLLHYLNNVLRKVLHQDLK
jgi:hypothetical protein